MNWALVILMCFWSIATLNGVIVLYKERNSDGIGILSLVFGGATVLFWGLVYYSGIFTLL